MELQLNFAVAKGYRSSSQIARVITEEWVEKNSFCPRCGEEKLNRFESNRPVADFCCTNCYAEYELKSKKDSFASKIVNGAYNIMIKRINSENNPHFLFLNYSSDSLQVQNFLTIPNHYFTNDIIERRSPLSQNARRAGWVGCNILLQNIPSSGKIFLVRDQEIERKAKVLENWSKTSFLAKQKIENRGWTIELLKIVEVMRNNEFELKDVYAFERTLKKKFPQNRFVKDKIRQQLQILRDKGIIEFLGNGRYVKV
ncbi:MAG: DpnI domain-containing protein [Ignavibacteriaceae bacterium]